MYLAYIKWRQIASNNRLQLTQLACKCNERFVLWPTKHNKLGGPDTKNNNGISSEGFRLRAVE